MKTPKKDGVKHANWLASGIETGACIYKTIDEAIASYERQTKHFRLTNQPPWYIVWSESVTKQLRKLKS